MIEKKVLILSTVHSVGDARIFHKEAKTLLKAGYDVSIIAQHAKNEIIEGIKIIALPKSKNRFQRIIFSPFRIIRLALKEKVDIYHFHDPELIPMGLISKLLHKKVIYDVHEDVSEQILSKDYIPNFIKKIVSVLFGLFEKSSSKKFDYIITVTNEIKNKFIKYNKNTIVVSNYTSFRFVENFKNKVIDLKQTNNVKIIFTGSIYNERGILEGLEAINLLRDLSIKFILYGYISNNNFLKKLKKIDIFDSLEYGGVLPYVDIFKKLQEVDIGYICDYPLKRHMESLPVKMFEYMSVGLPIVASNFPNWRNIIEGDQCGLLVDPLVPKEIANAIKYLTLNPKVRKEMGENGRRAILEKYNWENEGKKLINIYSMITKEV